MTSAIRRVIPSLLTGAKAGRLPRHSIFIFTPSPFSYTAIGPRFLSNPPESLSLQLTLFPPNSTIVSHILDDADDDDAVIELLNISRNKTSLNDDLVSYVISNHKIKQSKLESNVLCRVTMPTKPVMCYVLVSSVLKTYYVVLKLTPDNRDNDCYCDECTKIQHNCANDVPSKRTLLDHICKTLSIFRCGNFSSIFQSPRIIGRPRFFRDDIDITFLPNFANEAGVKRLHQIYRIKWNSAQKYIPPHFVCRTSIYANIYLDMFCYSSFATLILHDYSLKNTRNFRSNARNLSLLIPILCMAVVNWPVQYRFDRGIILCFACKSCTEKKDAFQGYVYAYIVTYVRYLTRHVMPGEYGSSKWEGNTAKYKAFLNSRSEGRVNVTAKILYDSDSWFSLSIFSTELTEALIKSLVNCHISSIFSPSLPKMKLLDHVLSLPKMNKLQTPYRYDSFLTLLLTLSYFHCLYLPLSTHFPIIINRVINYVESSHDPHGGCSKRRYITKNFSYYLIPHRYILTMPANSKSRQARSRGYNPLMDAEAPIPRDAWERRVNKTSLKPKRKSDSFRIPKTGSQEPSTLMPGSPYRHSPLSYANSRKADPRKARRTGSKPFPSPNEPLSLNRLFPHLAPPRDPNLPAKKAHLQWLHSTAIPNMDREIMKTNALIDNILTEQSDLDTQMTAIQAMGGHAAFQAACKSHAGLRKAIANRLSDTKKKRAKQFESIRSMRRVMQTLVAEIDDANTVRQDIRQSVYSNLGTNKSHSNISIINTAKSQKHANKYLLYFTGPNPRSLLRPEVNRNLNHHVTEPQANIPGPRDIIITPPTTPNSSRFAQNPRKNAYFYRNLQINNHPCKPKFMFFSRCTTPRQRAESTVYATSSSPTFSSDGDDYMITMPVLQPLLSPISSPERSLSQEQETEITLAARYYSIHKHPNKMRGRLYALVHRSSISFSGSPYGEIGYKYLHMTRKIDSQGTSSRGTTTITFAGTRSHYTTTHNSHTKWYSIDRAGLRNYAGTYAAIPGYFPVNTVSCSDRLRHSLLNLSQYTSFMTPTPATYPIINPAISLLLRTCIDILQAATEAAGIDGDLASSFSVEYESPSPPPASTPPRVSTPNRELINSRDPRRMPKNKNSQRGPAGTSPPKTPRTQGSRAISSQIKNTIARPITNNYISTKELIIKLPPNTATTEEDLLNMSGIQDGDQTLNSSGLDSTLQADASMNSDGQTEGQGGTTPNHEHFEQRQSTPNQETPQSNDQGKESENDSDSEEEDGDVSEEDEETDAKDQAEQDLQSDLGRVREAVSMAGGLNSKKPDFEKQKEREGQHVEIVEQWMDFTDETFDELPERPDESTLRRISLQELLPPATSTPVPLDMELDGEELTFVANQRIEFLVLMRKAGDTKTSWGFPCEAQLLKMYNHVRNAADHDQIMDVCLWCRVDGATGIASIMLSTINLPLFKRIRHEIRIYEGFPGFRCETYSKITFMQKYGVTLYIPKEVAGMNDKRLFKTLFRKYRHLNVKFLILTRTTFTKDHPDKPPHKRSRIGDTILLLDGPDLYEVLKSEPEDRKYFLNDGFSVTLRGGIRSTGPTALFASSFASQVISGLPAETMRQAENRA